MAKTLSENAVGPAQPEPRSQDCPPPLPGHTVLWRMLTFFTGPKIWTAASCQVGHSKVGSQGRFWRTMRLSSKTSPSIVLGWSFTKKPWPPKSCR